MNVDDLLDAWVESQVRAECDSLMRSLAQGVGEGAGDRFALGIADVQRARSIASIILKGAYPMTPSKHGGYGWKPDLPGAVKHLYAAPLRRFGALLPHYDLRPNCPPIWDQGQIGSCTAHAGGAAVQFAQMKEKKWNFTPSRLFIYYCTRDIEGTTASDAGASISDTIAALNKFGACQEPDWPYDVAKFAVKPPPNAYAAAAKDLVLQSAAVSQNLSQMIGCLADGYPFDIGIAVYDSFQSDAVASSGKVPMPDLNSEKLLGGHSVLVVGSDDPSRTFIVRNSWGTGWGMAGYFTIPYEYLLNPDLASDFQTIRAVEW